MNTLYDVVAVNLETKVVRLVAEGKTALDAAAVVTMAVLRRGVDQEFFMEVPAGSYQEAEQWVGQKETT